MFYTLGNLRFSIHVTSGSPISKFYIQKANVDKIYNQLNAMQMFLKTIQLSKKVKNPWPPCRNFQHNTIYSVQPTICNYQNIRVWFIERQL